MKSKPMYISLLFAVCALASLIDGAILGVDDGTVARIERDLPLGLKTVLTFLGNAGAQRLGGTVAAILFGLTFALLVLSGKRRLWLAIGAAWIGALTSGLLSNIVVRLSTMYVGDGSVLGFILAVFFFASWGFIGYFMLIGAAVTGLLWVLREVVCRFWRRELLNKTRTGQ